MHHSPVRPLQLHLYCATLSLLQRPDVLQVAIAHHIQHRDGHTPAQLVLNGVVALREGKKELVSWQETLLVIKLHQCCHANHCTLRWGGDGEW